MYYSGYIQTHCQKNKKIKRADQILPEVYGTTLNTIYYWSILHCHLLNMYFIAGPFKDFPQVTVYHPIEGNGHAFANFGWTGWIGSITGTCTFCTFNDRICFLIIFQI